MEINYSPIAVFCCENSRPYAAPRQAVLAKQSCGVVRLESFFTPDSVADLAGFDRIWLIYDFHHNDNWKPKVRPPRGSATKRSVFSTRSPYRPNSIGMSCVKLDKVEGLSLYVSEHDLLDGTPILDVKPYLPYADSFSESSTGWVSEDEKFEVEFSKTALSKLNWLSEQLDFDVINTVVSQLEYSPTSKKTKRVKAQDDGYVFSLQAWRLLFVVVDGAVKISDVLSGYGEAELASVETPAHERQVHGKFLEKFH